FPQIGSWFMSKGGWLAFAWSIGHSLAIIFFLWVIIEGIMKLVQASGLGAGLSGLGSDMRNRGGNPPAQPPQPQSQQSQQPPPPQAPSVHPPTNIRAQAADRSVIIRWEPPSGGNPAEYIITRYRRGRITRRLKRVGDIERRPNTTRVFLDPSPEKGNYIYSVQAVENNTCSEIESGYTEWVSTHDRKCDYRVVGIGTPINGVRGILLRLSSTGNQRFNGGGNVILYGIDPDYTTVIDNNIPIDNNWTLLPAPNDATVAYGSFELGDDDFNTLSGGGRNTIIFIFDTQYVGVN
ncbi:MAG: fibronectin type III domain-containing protein, partial [Candidatus Woesearchaeota archaeon]